MLIVKEIVRQPKPALTNAAGNITVGTLFRAKLYSDDKVFGVFLKAYDTVVDLNNPDNTYDDDIKFHEIVEVDGVLEIFQK